MRRRRNSGDIMKSVGYGFEKLDCWKEACRIAVDVCKLLEGCSNFSFKDHIQRTAVSISSNIAEGFERGSPKEFVRFLYIAKGSAGELRTQVYIAGRLNYIEMGACDDLIKRCRHISSMIQNLIKSVKTKSDIWA